MLRRSKIFWAGRMADHTTSLSVLRIAGLGSPSKSSNHWQFVPSERIQKQKTTRVSKPFLRQILLRSQPDDIHHVSCPSRSIFFPSPSCHSLILQHSAVCIMSLSVHLLSKQTAWRELRKFQKVSQSQFDYEFSVLSVFTFLCVSFNLGLLVFVWTPVLNYLDLSPVLLFLILSLMVHFLCSHPVVTVYNNIWASFCLIPSFADLSLLVNAALCVASFVFI